jgi:hypothetical protein
MIPPKPRMPHITRDIATSNHSTAPAPMPMTGNAQENPGSVAASSSDLVDTMSREERAQSEAYFASSHFASSASCSRVMEPRQSCMDSRPDETFNDDQSSQPPTITAKDAVEIPFTWHCFSLPGFPQGGCQVQAPKGIPSSERVERLVPLLDVRCQSWLQGLSAKDRKTAHSRLCSSYVYYVQGGRERQNGVCPCSLVPLSLLPADISVSFLSGGTPDLSLQPLRGDPPRQ